MQPPSFSFAVLFFWAICFLGWIWRQHWPVPQIKRPFPNLKRRRSLNFFCGPIIKPQSQVQKKQWQGQKGKGKGGILFLNPQSPMTSSCPSGEGWETSLSSGGAISPSPFVLHIIRQGYRLEFVSLPPRRFLVTRLPRDKVKAQALSLLVGDLVDQRVLVQVPPGEVGRGLSKEPFEPLSDLFSQGVNFQNNFSGGNHYCQTCQ